MEPMFIEELVEYAKKNGFDTGRFIVVTKKGIVEFQFLDAYFGFIQLVKDGKPDGGFFTTSALKEQFGRDAKYLATIGYN